MSGLVQPWYTHPALDVIEKWDLKGKRILEWGAGLSTLWWADRVGLGGVVCTIEHVGADFTWTQRVTEAAGPQVTALRQGEGTGLIPDDYARVPPGRWDIVIVDGTPCHLRTNCLASALALPRPLTIIFDNWQQDHVFIDPVAEEMMAPYAGNFYVQADHTDHNGRPWQTAIWHLS